MASAEWTDNGQNFERAEFNAVFLQQLHSDPRFAVEMLTEATKAQVSALDCDAIANLLSSSRITCDDRFKVFATFPKLGRFRNYDFG